MPVRNCCLRPFRKLPAPLLVLAFAAPVPAVAATGTELIGGSEPTYGRAPRPVLASDGFSEGFALAPGGRATEDVDDDDGAGETPFVNPRWPLSWSRNEPPVVPAPVTPPMEEATELVIAEPENGAPTPTPEEKGGASGRESESRTPAAAAAPTLVTSTLAEKRECVGELGALNCERRALVALLGALLDALLVMLFRPEVGAAEAPNVFWPTVDVSVSARMEPMRAEAER